MPIVYRADKALGCTIVIWDGDFSGRDMRRQLRRMAADLDWPPGPRHLVDGSTIGTVTMPEPDLLELLYEGTNLAEKMRIAAVVRPELVEAVGSLSGRRDGAPVVPYKTPNTEFHIAAFTALDAASAYLGLDPTAVQNVIDELRQQL